MTVVHDILEKDRERKEQRTEEFIESQKGGHNNSRTSRDADQWAIVDAEEQPNINLEEKSPTLEANVDINIDDNNVSDHEPILNSSHTENASIDEQPIPSVDIYD